MKIHWFFLVICCVCVSFSGCAHLKQDSLLAHALRDRLDDYHQSATLAPLKMPEGATAHPIEDAMPIPQ